MTDPTVIAPSVLDACAAIVEVHGPVQSRQRLAGLLRGEAVRLARETSQETTSGPRAAANPAGGETCAPGHQAPSDRRTEPASYTEPRRTA